MLKLGYPWLSLKLAQLYPYLSRFIPTYTREGYPGISHYKNLILGYPKTTFLSRLILGYPGISHGSCYPRISRYKSGYGRVSFFQMESHGQFELAPLLQVQVNGKKRATSTENLDWEDTWASAGHWQVVQLVDPHNDVLHLKLFCQRRA